MGDLWTDIGGAVTSAWNTITGQAPANKQPFYNQSAAIAQQAANPTPDTSQHIMGVGLGSDNGGAGDQAAVMIENVLLAVVGAAGGPAGAAVAAGFKLTDAALRATYAANTAAFVAQWQKTYGTQAPSQDQVLGVLGPAASDSQPTIDKSDLWKKIAIGAGIGLLVAGPAGGIAGGGSGFLYGVIKSKAQQ